ncbi:unnamed protein product [Calypogeia fissa]
MERAREQSTGDSFTLVGGDTIAGWLHCTIYNAGVRALADVVVVYPMGASMVSSAAHIHGHAASHATQLKEEVYAIRYHGDLFYPFAIEVLGRFTWPWTSYFSPRGPLRGAATVSPGLGGNGLS